MDTALHAGTSAYPREGLPWGFAIQQVRSHYVDIKGLVLRIRVSVPMGSASLRGGQLDLDVLGGEQGRVVPWLCNFVLFAHRDHSVLVHIRSSFVLCQGWQYSKNPHINNTCTHEMQMRKCSYCMIRVMIPSIMLEILVKFFLHRTGVWPQSHKAIWHLGCWRVRATAEPESPSSNVQIWLRVGTESTET